MDVDSSSMQGRHHIQVIKQEWTLMDTKNLLVFYWHISHRKMSRVLPYCVCPPLQWKRPVFAAIEHDSIFSHNLQGSFEIVSDLLSHPSWMSIQTEHPFLFSHYISPYSNVRRVRASNAFVARQLSVLYLSVLPL